MSKDNLYFVNISSKLVPVHINWNLTLSKFKRYARIKSKKNT